MLSEKAKALLEVSKIPRLARLADLEGWDATTYSSAVHELIKRGLIEVREPEAGEAHKSHYAVLVYAAGIAVWIGIWATLFGFEVLLNTNLGLFGSRGHIIIFLIPPHAVAALALGSNAWLWKVDSRYAAYEIEVKIIEFVERNASFFLVGSSAVFFFASFSIRDLGLKFSFPAFIIYETLSLICLSTVLLLYWVPYSEKSENLVRLRHLKTIPFAYAVSFFLAALMIITTAALPVVVP